ncbi:glycoside hydrolase family 19 protein [Rhodococcus kronopolitis]|uniref:Glycoside hydrolase family 19 protein n=1 Tax=Rhodococcus kronopolitis TaxID=1460226 RepID=A0ABV9FS91_9NOCA
MTTSVVGFVGPGVAAADTADTVAAGVVAAPVRFHEAGDLFKTLKFGTLPGADSGSADEAAPASAEPAPEAVPAPPAAVTPDELARIVPGMPAEKIAAYVEPLNAAMARGGIDNPVRQAAFIAQLAVESDGFRTFEEYASGRAYEGRADLGNIQAGDGERYKGRGAIQITGRHNYEQVSQYTGVDFVAQPELLQAPENAFTTAAWYWTSRNLNQVADTAGIVRVSELVNGGHHALERRVQDFQRGLDVLLHP